MGKVINEAGNRYGKWTVIRRSNVKGAAEWLCRCDCGTEREVVGSSLRIGNSKSCGCLQRERASEARLIGMVGRKHGRLTAVERAGTTHDGAATWLCECECGNKIVVRGTSLRYGSTKSCGCLKIEMLTLPQSEAAFNVLFGRLKTLNAKKRGLKWGLTREQVHFLTQQPCYYCGAQPSMVIDRRGNGIYVYNGLDRVNSDGGYTEDNVVPCCRTCNNAKASMAIDQFRTWGRNLYEHFVEQGGPF